MRLDLAALAAAVALAAPGSALPAGAAKAPAGGGKAAASPSKATAAADRVAPPPRPGSGKDQGKRGPAAKGKARRGIPWVTDDYEKALAAARARGAPLVVDVWAPW